MANLLILDDNKAASAFLKLVLLRQRHQVSRSMEAVEAMGQGPTVARDLVLINQAFKNNSGWQVFNDLKKRAPNLPAMVYVLEELTLPIADWIGKAVETVLSESSQSTTLRRPKNAV